MDPSLSTEDVRGTAAGANARLKASMIVDLFNLVGIHVPPCPDELPSMAAAHAAAAAQHAQIAATRRLSPAEVADATVRHVDAEYRRSLQGRWRRLLPSSQSVHYSQFVQDEGRRKLNLLPFALSY